MTALIVASTILPACMLSLILLPTLRCCGAGLRLFGTAGLYDKLKFEGSERYGYL